MPVTCKNQCIQPAMDSSIRKPFCRWRNSPNFICPFEPRKEGPAWSKQQDVHLVSQYPWGVFLSEPASLPPVDSTLYLRLQGDRLTSRGEIWIYCTPTLKTVGGFNDSSKYSKLIIIFLFHASSYTHTTYKCLMYTCRYKYMIHYDTLT